MNWILPAKSLYFLRECHDNLAAIVCWTGWVFAGVFTKPFTELCLCYVGQDAHNNLDESRQTPDGIVCAK